MRTNTFSCFNFFFSQLLCLPTFSDFLPCSKLLIKNYESHFPSDGEWGLTGIQLGRYAAKAEQLQHSTLYAFLNFSVLPKVTGRIWHIPVSIVCVEVFPLVQLVSWFVEQFQQFVFNP